MSTGRVRLIVVRRVRLREDLKPAKPYWQSECADAEWVLITRAATESGYETFELQLIKLVGSACQGHPVRAGLAGSMSYETLRIAKAQAHADIGVEYVEWEPCEVEITNEDGSIDWGKALPHAELEG